MKEKATSKNLFSITLFSGPVVGILFGVLLYVKLFTERGATLPWYWVVSPLWIPWAFVVGFFIAWYLIAGICFAIGYALIGIAELIQWIGKIFRKRK